LLCISLPRLNFFRFNLLCIDLLWSQLCRRTFSTIVQLCESFQFVKNVFTLALCDWFQLVEELLQQFCKLCDWFQLVKKLVHVLVLGKINSTLPQLEWIFACYKNVSHANVNNTYLETESCIFLLRSTLRFSFLFV
jgi:hypothetical protein